EVGKLKVRDVWNLMAKFAWRTGDPGVIFIDEINRHNPTPEIGRIEATNPCSEQPLLPYESCNLGSINLSRMVDNLKINWEKLRETIRNAVHFLDNVIDANKFPLKKIEEMTKANRKIGLGVMGFADMLIKLGIPYDSEEALKLAERVMEFVTKEARKKSMELGEERGSFSNFERSIWKDRYHAMKNATVTTIAPTGSISIIAGCSSGIEPLFAISFIRNVLSGARLFEINPLFEIIAKERGFYSAKLLEEIARIGSIKENKELPEDVKRIFVTALDISPEWHVKMQAAFQKYTDNAASKTVNLPFEASVEDVRKIFELACSLKCKGITVFRYGSKPEQVLYIGEIKTKNRKFISAEPEYAGGCPAKTCPFPD
ncbi:MAG: adenosylcobalamin-dependent ribonucleoside-diphosphate reductase, partial [Methanophagales archaeon]|nr:adenosylcobalamin-dependent ribonucleoside-diphosphate reductase [Methanophagales archaeon]